LRRDSTEVYISAGWGRLKPACPVKIEVLGKREKDRAEDRMFLGDVGSPTHLIMSRTNEVNRIRRQGSSLGEPCYVLVVTTTTTRRETNLANLLIIIQQ
jgi:hypothetical protein